LDSDLIVRQITQNDLNPLKQIIDLSFPRVYRFFVTHGLQEEGQVIVGVIAGRIVGFAKLIGFYVGGKSMVAYCGLQFTPVSEEKASQLQ
jgi:hypothetical protein